MKKPAAITRSTFFSASMALVLSLSWTWTSPAAAEQNSLQEIVRTFVLQQMQGNSADQDVQVKVEPLAAKLPPCVAPTAFAPPGHRFRPGRVTVGVRCENGRSRYVSAEVTANGNYLEVTSSVQPGQTLTEEDVQTRRGNMADLPRDVVTRASLGVGKVAVRRLEPGTVLRRHHLRSLPLVERGESVAVESRGRGFVVRREGVALENGGSGDSIRVRTSRRDTLRAQVTADGRLVVESGSSR